MTDIESEVDAGDNISMKSSVSFSACSLLDNMVGQIRESMGVESHAPSSVSRYKLSVVSLFRCFPFLHKDLVFNAQEYSNVKTSL